MIGEVRRRGREWQERLLDLRAALGELYAAEAAALSRDMARWGKGLAIALLLAFAALTLLFWLLAVLIGLVVAAIAVWLPVWAAMGITALLVTLATLLLGWVAWRRMQRLGGPLALIGRRWRDHADWWQERVLGEPDTPEGEDHGRP